MDVSFILKTVLDGILNEENEVVVLYKEKDINWNSTTLDEFGKSWCELHKPIGFDMRYVTHEGYIEFIVKTDIKISEENKIEVLNNINEKIVVYGDKDGKYQEYIDLLKAIWGETNHECMSLNFTSDRTWKQQAQVLFFSISKALAPIKIRDYYNMLFGAAITISLMALYTDILGMERYIAQLRSPGGWIDAKMSVPIYIGILIFNLYGVIYNNKDK